MKRTRKFTSRNRRPHQQIDANMTYAAMLGYFYTHGYPPSVRDIMAMTGYRSTSSVVYALDIMEFQGWLERDKRQSRAIRFIKDVDTTAPAGLR